MSTRKRDCLSQRQYGLKGKTLYIANLDYYERVRSVLKEKDGCVKYLWTAREPLISPHSKS